MILRYYYFIKNANGDNFEDHITYAVLRKGLKEVRIKGREYDFYYSIKNANTHNFEDDIR